MDTQATVQWKDSPFSNQPLIRRIRFRFLTQKMHPGNLCVTGTDSAPCEIYDSIPGDISCLDNHPAKGRNMKTYHLLALALVSTLVIPASAFRKDIMHFASIPVIEGLGIYSAVTTIRDADEGYTKATAGTALGILAGNAAIGAVTVFGPKDNYPQLRKVHRVVGVIAFAGATALSIVASLDDGVADATRYTAYGYNALTAVPVILFAF